MFIKECKVPSPTSFFVNCLLLVAVVAVADITITEWALHHQSATEANQVVASLHESDIWSLMAFRFATIAGLLLALVISRLDTNEYVSLLKTPTLDLFLCKGDWKKLERKTRWKLIVWTSVLGITFTRAVIVISNVVSSMTGYSVISGVEAALPNIDEQQSYLAAMLISVTLGFAVLAVVHTVLSKGLGGEPQIARD